MRPKSFRFLVSSFQFAEIFRFASRHSKLETALWKLF